MMEHRATMRCDEHELDEVRLPNGVKVHAVSRGEALLLYREIFLGCCYSVQAGGGGAGTDIIDVGAHIGLASIFLHGLYPEARVFALEPAPRLHSALTRNLAECGIRGHALQVAAGRRSEEGQFTWYPRAPGMSGLWADPDRDRAVTVRYLRRLGMPVPEIDALVAGMFEPEQLSCRVIPLADIMDKYAIADVAVLKIDAERSELDVLTGLAPRHWGRIRQVVMEVHDRPSVTNVERLLDAQGFKCHVEQNRQVRGSGMWSVRAKRS